MYGHSGKDLKNQTVVLGHSILRYWTITDGSSVMMITIPKSRLIDCPVLTQNYAYRMVHLLTVLNMIARSYIRLSDIKPFWSPGIMVGPLVLNGLRNSSIVSLQAGLVLSWFLKSTDKHFMSSHRMLIIFIYSGISKFYDLQILELKKICLYENFVWHIGSESTEHINFTKAIVLIFPTPFIYITWA